METQSNESSFDVEITEIESMESASSSDGF